MIIDCVADLHGHDPALPGGDLLIIAGDCTARDSPNNWWRFSEWFKKQPYTHKIVVAGNHDGMLEYQPSYATQYFGPGHYLQDSGCEIMGLKIWGTPWSLWFGGINPRCTAFTGDEDDLKTKYDLIPDDTNLIISHSPPWGMLDANLDGYLCGSKALRDALDRVKPRYFVCGHIHEQGGKQMLYKHLGPNTWCINCSHVNEDYEPVHSYVRLEIP